MKKERGSAIILFITQFLEGSEKRDLTEWSPPLAHWHPLSTAAADDEVELQEETKGQRSETHA